MSFQNFVTIIPRDGKWYLIPMNASDAEMASFLSFFERYLRRSAAGDAPIVDRSATTHENVVSSYLNAFRQIGDDAQDGPWLAESVLAGACREYTFYLEQKCHELSANPVAAWGNGIQFAERHPEAARVLLAVITEQIHHLYSFVRDRAPALCDGDVATDEFDALLNLLPGPVAELRTEADLSVVTPWFFKTIEQPGGPEFGCLRGTMSIKFAYALKVLGQKKTVYAFDTFTGFDFADPSGGPSGRLLFR